MFTSKSLSKTNGELYLDTLSRIFNEDIFKKIDSLAFDLKDAWLNKKNIFICGNGGSAANAIHIANDFLYGAGACGEGPKFPGLKVESLTSNQAVLTCLANDVGYENIFSHQLNVKGNSGDILIALSGSGNSKNIINALEISKKIGIISHAILGFKGGDCLKKCDNAIYFPVDDMQIAEDTQLIVSHICMQWLTKNKP